jgi:hypothetical protein
MKNMKPIPFFQFEGRYSGDLLVDSAKQQNQWRYESCPIGGNHGRRGYRVGELHYYLKHNRRNEHIIWGGDIAIHASVLENFASEGFTGFRTKPAKITFLDGETSDEYREFIVTGWAGAVQPESGMRLLDSCAGCLWKNYGPIHDFTQVLDWDQWTGEDFFIVWPLIGHKLCTERVATWLENSGIRSFSLGRGFELLEKKRDSLNYGIPRGPLSAYLPEDLAIKYGRPLGLE